MVPAMRSIVRQAQRAGVASGAANGVSIMRNRKWGNLRAAIVAVVVTMAAPWCPLTGTAQEVAPGLKVGDVLDQGNAQLAKDLLPAEILKHYEKGEYRNKI